MTQHWHIAVDGVQHGPLTADEIRARGPLPAQALVWTDGMAQWLPVAQTPLAGLAGGAGALAPPLPGSPSNSLPGSLPAGGAMGGGPAVGVGPGEAVRIALRKFATFSGRASRSEFWWFVAFNILVGLALGILDGLLGLGGLSVIASLALLLPTIAVAVRRLHDTDRTGWWYLLTFVPFGFLVLIFFWVQEGTPGPNRFG